MGYAARVTQRANAMIRRVQFEATPLHQVYFRLICEAFRSRGSANPEEKVTKDDRRSESKILRGLKAISVPVGEAPTDGQIDGRALVLADTGGTLPLEQPEFKRLQGYIERTQWQSGIADVVADLEDWLDAAEKHEALP